MLTVDDHHVHRRHLQSGQAAACFKKREVLEAELAAAVEAVRADAKERQRKGGEEKVLQTFEEPKPNDRLTDAARAKMAGTNRQYIHDADTLAEKAPDLLDAVVDGEKSIVQAKRELKERQREAKRAEAAEQIAAAPTIWPNRR